MAGIDRCWAKSLDDCQGAISREHIISKSQFDDESITVSGFPWCEKPKPISVANLVANILCERHNNQLSETDNAALIAKRKLAAFFNASKSSKPFNETIDRRLFERWLLKTSINVQLQDKASGWHPTESDVLVAFGLKDPPENEGLHIAMRIGERVSPAFKLEFEMILHKDSKALAICVANFHSYRFYYAFAGAPKIKGAIRRPNELNSTEKKHRLLFR